MRKYFSSVFDVPASHAYCIRKAIAEAHLRRYYTYCAPRAVTQVSSYVTTSGGIYRSLCQVSGLLRRL